MKINPTIQDLKVSPYLVESKDGKIMRIIFPNSLHVGTNADGPDATTVLRTGLSLQSVTKTRGPVAVRKSDVTICIAPTAGYDSSGNRFDVMLPSDPTIGQLHVVKDVDGTAATVVPRVLPSGAKTIDSATYYELTLDYLSVGFMWTGTEWSVIFVSNTAGGGGGAPTNATYVTLTNNATLTQERALAVSSDLSLADGGANSSVTLGLGSTTVVPGTYTNAGFVVDAKGRITSASNGTSGGAPVGSAYVTIGSDGTLTAERALTAGVGTYITDGGANSSVTVGVNDAIFAALSGSTFSGIVNAGGGLSGSLQQTTSGLSYLVAGSNVTIASQSNGQVIISSTGGGSGSSSTTTASFDNTASSVTYLNWSFNSSELVGTTKYLNLGLSSSLLNTLTATLSTAIITNESGVFGEAVGFVGTGLMTSADPVSNIGGQRFTVQLWIRPYVLSSGYKLILGKQYVSGSNTSPYMAISLFQPSDNGLIEFGLTTSGLRTTGNSSERLKSEQWNHIALVYDGANIKGYMNGNEVYRSSKTGDIDYGTTPGSWLLGGNSATSSEYYSGSIDDIKIEAVARSTEEIRATYERGVFRHYVLRNIALLMSP